MIKTVKAAADRLASAHDALKNLLSTLPPSGYSPAQEAALKARTDELRVARDELMAAQATEAAELGRKAQEAVLDDPALRTLLGADLPGGWSPPGRKSTGTWGAKMISEIGRTGAKALVPSGSIVAPGAFDPAVHDLGRPASFLRAVIPTANLDGDLVQYRRQTIRTLAAAAVPMGGLKPTSSITAETVQARPVTIAHLSEPQDRATLADAPSLQSFLEGELRLGLLLEVDRELIAGDPAAGELEGLANLPGSQVQAFDGDALTTLRRAIGKVSTVALTTASHVVVNPADWESIELTRDSQGRYLLEASPVNPAEARIWGVPVVASVAVPPGTAYVGDFSGNSRLYQREAARIDWSESVGDSFQRNQVIFRAEERLVVAWMRPQAFVEVALA